MGKLRILSGADVRRILEDHGFVFIKQSGSHIIMQKKFLATTITVPVPNHKEIRIGTLKSIIRQSGIPQHIFETK